MSDLPINKKMNKKKYNLVNDRSAFNYNGPCVSTAFDVTWWVEINWPWTFKDTIMWCEYSRIDSACQITFDWLYAPTDGSSWRARRNQREIETNSIPTEQWAVWSTYLSYFVCFTVIFSFFRMRNNNTLWVGAILNTWYSFLEYVQLQLTTK